MVTHSITHHRQLHFYKPILFDIGYHETSQNNIIRTESFQNEMAALFQLSVNMQVYSSSKQLNNYFVKAGGLRVSFPTI